MTITARYRGTCGNCGQDIETGDQINWIKGKGSTHVKCSPKAAKPSPKSIPTIIAAQEKTAAVRAIASAKTWSEFQIAIFDFIEKSDRSGVICAVAGSGKTTTIVEAANRVPAHLTCCFVAFNKTIAEELKSRLPKHFPAKTLNGFGFSAWIQHTGKRQMNLKPNKTADILRELLFPEDAKMYAKGVVHLVSKAKAIGLVPKGNPGTHSLVADTDQAWIELIEFYEITFEKGAETARAIQIARDALTISIQQASITIDYDDQIYMPVISGTNIRKHDILFVDEAQDVNSVQRAMLRMALKPEGRLIAVGDPYQAIYGFRGADTNSINNIRKEFNAVDLPLSISYRCPKAVVAEAQTVVPHIKSAETAPEGSVDEIDEYDAAIFTSTDGIICRNTAPIIGLAYKLIAQEKACRVLGRAIGDGLVTLIEKMDADNIDQLQDRLAEFQAREVEKALSKGREQSASTVADKVETLNIFISNLPESGRTIENLISRIESLFTDDKEGNVTTLCTIHKAKGLEWHRVFFLDRHRIPSQYARQEWQKEQENNLLYVAITRAKSELVYITLDNFDKQKRAGGK